MMVHVLLFDSEPGWMLSPFISLPFEVGKMLGGALDTTTVV